MHSRVQFLPLIVLSLAFALLWIVSTSSGAAGDPGEFERPALAYPKLGTFLNGLTQQSRRSGLAMNSGAEQAPLSHGSTVGVTVHVSSGAGDVERFLGQNGVSVRHRGGSWLEAFVPVDILGPLSEMPSVRQVRPIVLPQEHLGEALSEAAELHGAIAWNRYGYMGSGVKVGIIDLGFSGITGLVGSELPTNIRSRCYSLFFGAVADDLEYCDLTARTVHGTAVAETIADIAPDATLYIADVSTNGDVRDAVNWMIEEGVTVINMSLGSSWDGSGDGTSRFEDSLLNTVDVAADNGILWVNSAGNNARDTWTGNFTDADDDGLMEFVDGDETNSVPLSPGRQYLAELRWEGDWGNANTDLDLYLVRVDGDDVEVLTGDMIEGYSVNPQSGEDDQDPYEQMIFYPSSSSSNSADWSLVIKHVRGEIPVWVQVRSFYGENLEHATASGSIGSPAESDNDLMLAVGAAPWWNHGEIEYFSSQGPTTDGRTKPELVGADRAVTKSYGPEFPGTSQSSPHVAGMAALVRGRYPTLTATGTAEYLKDNAEDRGATGVDNVWGAGFAKLPPIDGSPPFSLGDIRLAVEEKRVAGRFGNAVAFDGDTLVVGAELDDAGAVYVYTAPVGEWSSAIDWSEAVRLTPPDGMSGDKFGSSVAVDGGTIVVGAPGNDQDAGAAYVFTKSAEAWQNISSAAIRLPAPAGAPGDQLGTAVAVDGDTVVVGAPGVDSSAAQDAGAAYVFVRSDEGWSASITGVTLTASDEVTADAFGRSVSIDADTIVVGAPRAAGPNHDDQGAAYVFTKSGDEWNTTDSDVKLTSATGGAGDRFGFSTSIDGDTIAVGAPIALSRLVLRCGTVHLFNKPAGGWSASSDSYQFSDCDSVGDRFGYSVDVDGDAVMMGVPQPTSSFEGAGRAYVLTRSDGAWSASSTVTRLSLPNGGTADDAGFAVALADGYAFIGAPGRQESVGAVGVFSRVGEGWRDARQFIELSPVGQRFGASVDMHNGFVAVGAPLARGADGQSTGGVHVFTEPLDHTQVPYSLGPEDVDRAARFGSSVALLDDLVVSGAPGSGSQAAPGRAYAFTKTAGGSWDRATTTKLSASDEADGNAFGESLDMDENTLVIGAPGAGSRAGAAYIIPVDRISGAATTTSIRLTASDGASGDELGASVAVAGNTVVVGAPGGGAAYLFTRPSGGWSSTSSGTKLAAPNGANPDGFGASVAIDGDIVVVGAPLVQGSDGKLGAVYVFNLTDTSVPVELTSPDGIRSERFGATVAIDGNSIIVGAPGGSGVAAGSGAAYRFTIVDDEIILASKLMAERYNPGAGFGAAVATHDGMTVIGARLEERTWGAAYLFGTNHPVEFKDGFLATRRIRENTSYALPTFVLTADDPDNDAVSFEDSGSGDFKVESDDMRDDLVKVTFAPQTPSNAKMVLDYESKNWYSVTVLARDGFNQFGIDDSNDIDDRFTIIVEVTNEEEPGSIGLSTTNPQVGEKLTATVTDPDSVSVPLSYVAWTWQSSTDSDTWTDVASTITDVNSVEFIPSIAQEGNRLRVVAEYDDGHGSGKVAVSAITAPVAAALSTPTPVPTPTNTPQQPGSSGGGGGGGGGSTRRTSTPTPILDPVEIRVFGPSEDVAEGDVATFTVEASSKLRERLEIDWSVDSESTAMTTDFESVSGRITLPRGSSRGSSGTFAVPVFDDSLSEEQESFAVSIFPRTDPETEALELVKRRASANIRESDPITVLLRGESSVDEGQPAVYAISLSGGLPTADLTVGYELSAGTAEIGPDLEVAIGSLTFTPTDDGLRLVTVNTLTDDLIEDPETFTFSLVSVVGGGGPQPILGEPSEVRTTLVDVAPVGTPLPEPPVATPTLAPVTPVPAGSARSVVVSVPPHLAVVVESQDLRHRLTIPAAARDAEFQVRLDSTLDRCASAPPVEFIPALCATVEVFDREGRYEADVELAEPAELTFNLLPPDVERLGGLELLIEVHEARGVKVLTRDEPDAAWSELAYVFETHDDGGVSIVVAGITRFSSFALVVHELILGLVPHGGEATGTATPSPVPAPQMAAPLQPTATAGPPTATNPPPPTATPIVAGPSPTRSPAAAPVALLNTATPTATLAAMLTPTAEPVVSTSTVAPADISEPEDEATPLWQFIVVVALAVMILALGAVTLRLRRR